MGKKKRASKTSSGARKARAGRYDHGNGPSRKAPIADHETAAFLKAQSRDRWPTEETKVQYYTLNLAKEKRGPSRKRPSPLGLPLMEQAMGHGTKEIARLLTAASLKMKRVRRHPGWILVRTYNLKTRPIEIV